MDAGEGHAADQRVKDWIRQRTRGAGRAEWVRNVWPREGAGKEKRGQGGEDFYFFDRIMG